MTEDIRNAAWDPLAGETKRILVVDGDEELRDAEVELLRESACEVAAAPDGRRGFEVAIDWHPDAIVVDPDLRGTMAAKELVEALRADPRTAGIQIILT